MDADGLGRGRRGGEHREHLRQRPRIVLLSVAWTDVLIECPGGPGAPHSGKVEELLEDTAFQLGQGFAGRRWELGTLRCVVPREHLAQLVSDFGARGEIRRLNRYAQCA